ncbi:MAG TPA: anti-sigma factor RsbA family regulatory protein [Pseudonocardia sp.]|jgi:anti-sigma regulatory factor (Ser/Thr protein kinase)|nr:anti-sigma factor RsbA family regulatory protein [Pseudonocardia sp.]
MRTGAAAGTRGYFHEAARYSSDAEFLAIVLPFVQAGAAAGEPVMLALGERNEGLVRAALPDLCGLTFIPGEKQYVTPAHAIRTVRDRLAARTADGARQIRIVGDVPTAGWHRWARYEAAVNRAYDDFPVWGLCPYDTRSTPPEVLADVARTHPRLHTADGGHVVNPDFENPEAFLTDRLLQPRPAEPGPALLDTAVAGADQVRHLVRDLAAAELAQDHVDDLVLAASEVVTNALVHGREPVRLRLWRAPARVVVAITDGGCGVRDPYSGLLPARRSASAGLGLWLCHQICRDVGFHRDEDGFTVRLVAGPG